MPVLIDRFDLVHLAIRQVDLTVCLFRTHQPKLSALYLSTEEAVQLYKPSEW
jgi:hypothetical protein